MRAGAGAARPAAGSLDAAAATPATTGAADAAPRDPALDGIRGLAIVLVAVAHGWEQVPGGVFGVDVFFVLSGYLITTLLRRELAHAGSISLARFYGRRILRLYPALLLLLVLVAVLGAVLRTGTGGERLSVSVPAVLLFVANWVQAADPVSFGVLSHMWSLAVEEQFYLVWPALLVILSTRLRNPIPWLLAGAAVSVMARFALSYRVDYGLAVWTFLRIDGLILGAVIAWLPRDVLRRLVAGKPWLGWLALAGLLALVHVAGRYGTGAQLFELRGGYTGASIAAAIMVASVLGDETTSFARFFAVRGLRDVGRISYGLYLYHLPLLAAADHHFGLDVGRPIGYAAALAAGILSWLAVERPILGLRDRLPRGMRIAAGRAAA